MSHWSTLSRFSALVIFCLLGGNLAYAATDDEVLETEVRETETEVVHLPTSDPKTAIEVIIGKRIADTVREDGRPHHVYRPRTPIFHQYHPENEPVPPAIRKHLLVDHPELNNNQGRNIRTPPENTDEKNDTSEN